MSDLRAAVEGLPPVIRNETATDLGDVSRAAVLALIPEGSVLVTEAALARVRANWPDHFDAGMAKGWIAACDRIEGVIIARLRGEK